MQYTKTKPNIGYEEFIKLIGDIQEFSSTTGKRYKVSQFDSTHLKFNRLDGKKPEMEWTINLAKLYQAYQSLNDFSTINFKPFVPITHSPGRGLLIRMGLLKIL